MKSTIFTIFAYIFLQCSSTCYAGTLFFNPTPPSGGNVPIEAEPEIYTNLFAGDSIVFSFDTMPLTTGLVFGLGSAVPLHVRIPVIYFESSDRLRLQLFETSFTDVPFVDTTWPSDTSEIGLSGIFQGYSEVSALSDFQGKGRLILEEGEIGISSIEIQRNINGQQSRTVSFSIPEPANFSFLLATFSLLLIFHRRKRNGA
jgi:hypothetical protein